MIRGPLEAAKGKGLPMPGKSYVGKAGQMAVMAEFLLRGYNVAMPEVDVGDDIFVVHDKEGVLWRIQVKTAIGKATGYGFSGQFAVTAKQLAFEKTRDLIYVFALRADARWEFLVVPRSALHGEQKNHQIASPAGRNLIFNLRFGPTEVYCSTRDFQPYRNRWDEWPIVDA